MNDRKGAKVEERKRERSSSTKRTKRSSHMRSTKFSLFYFGGNGRKLHRKQFRISFSSWNYFSLIFSSLFVATEKSKRKIVWRVFSQSQQSDWLAAMKRRASTVFFFCASRKTNRKCTKTKKNSWSTKQNGNERWKKLTTTYTNFEFKPTMNRTIRNWSRMISCFFRLVLVPPK